MLKGTGLTDLIEQTPCFVCTHREMCFNWFSFPCRLFKKMDIITLNKANEFMMEQMMYKWRAMK